MAPPSMVNTGLHARQRIEQRAIAGASGISCRAYLVAGPPEASRSRELDQSRSSHAANLIAALAVNIHARTRTDSFEQASAPARSPQFIIRQHSVAALSIPLRFLIPEAGSRHFLALDSPIKRGEDLAANPVHLRGVSFFVLQIIEQFDYVGATHFRERLFAERCRLDVILEHALDQPPPALVGLQVWRHTDRASRRQFGVARPLSGAPELVPRPAGVSASFAGRSCVFAAATSCGHLATASSVRSGAARIAIAQRRCAHPASATNSEV